MAETAIAAPAVVSSLPVSTAVTKIKIPRPIWLTAISVLLTAMVVVGWLFVTRSAHTLGEKDAVLLADVTDTTAAECQRILDHVDRLASNVHSKNADRKTSEMPSKPCS